ncbi:MAG: molecular chaperone [Burkholderiales bacterium]|nr:molecular chaperone [Burkholderiales bacterium]
MRLAACHALLQIFFGFFLVAPAMAGVLLESSRVVFASQNREQSLLLLNENSYPVLIQAWIDNGAPEGTPSTAESPIMPLPGLFRLEAGERKNLRLLNTGLPQAQDKESLYWLNIYEIPPVDANLPQDATSLTVAIRLQLKMFFRPKLDVSIEALSNSLKFSLDPKQKTLKVENPMPYFATLSCVRLMRGEQGQDLHAGMLAPFSSLLIKLDEPFWDAGRSDLSVEYAIIDDDGNERVESQRLKNN